MIKSDQPFRVKLEAWYHLTANLSYPLMVVLSVLLLPAMIIRFYQGWFQMLYIDLPLFLASTFSISSFYLVSQRELFPEILAASLALSAISDGAGHRPDHYQHARRAGSADRKEVGLCAHAQVSRGIESRPHQRRQVPAAPGWVPWVELLIGSYFALTVYYAIANENYITVPFLVLFVVGYWYTGLMSLLQGRFSGLSMSAETHTKPFPVGV